MSELQAALLVIGLGVVVAVYVFGWWQQRRYSRKFGAAFKAGHADALYQENAAKPAEQIQHTVTIDDEAPDETAPLAADHQVTLAAEPVEMVPPDESCALLNERSDFIIELNLAEAAPASVLDGLWQRKFDFGKPLHVCGLTVNPQRWERASAESHTLYARFRVALQLVDRGGAISAAKLANFRDLVVGLAAQIKADTTVPDHHKAHSHAVELDAFCVDVDQMVGVNLVPPGERLIPGATLAHAAASQGMTLGSDGAFHFSDEQGHTLFNLINRDSKPFQHHTLETTGTAGITLLLDAPRVAEPALQFDQMVRVAHELAKQLQLNMVDDHRVVLSEGGLARIRAQIAEIDTKMREHGIVPGSRQARRLFS